MHSEDRHGAGAVTGHNARGADHHVDCCCDVDIHIDSRGDVNIYNCAPSSAVGPSDCPPCPPPRGTCIPVAAGAKHKLSREQKLGSLVDGMAVPSSIAAGVIHMMRRFLLDKSPANPLETSAFATFGKISRDLLTCTLAAIDAATPGLGSRLFAQSLLGDPTQPLDEAALTTALGQEIVQRIGVQVFGDPNGLDQERPGRVRVFEPQAGEEIQPNQVLICRINDLRTGYFVPAVTAGDYLPAEIQHDCAVQIVDGQPQVVCQVRTTDCPGNSLPGGAVCGRVLDVAFGDGLVLEGVNYFSVDAKVRFSDKQTGNPVRDVDTHVWGDLDTPVTEVVNGETRLINDCRVHDRLTFTVPDDLAPGIYMFQVVVPNITGVAALGAELISNGEYVNVLPAPTTRFEIGTESILARKETSPGWWGSDEVGLHTMASALDANLQLVDLPDFADPSKRATTQEQRFKDLQNVDFDSGTRRDITRKVFAPDKQILGMLLVVLGDEIDSQHAYDAQITSNWDYFVDLVKDQLPYISGAVAGAGGDLLKNFSGTKAILEGVALLVLAGIDGLIAWWAPADPIIRDAIALSVNDLATLTSANAPPPDPRHFTSENGIVVRVNETVPPVKLPLEYHEVREYDCAAQDSLYEITYRFSRVA
jgi:hypothetical protein